MARCRVTPTNRWLPPHEARALAVCWLSDTELFTGGDDKQVTHWQARTGKKLATVQIGSRIKSFAVLPHEIGDAGRRGFEHIGQLPGCTSAGEVFVVRPTDGAIVARRD